MYKPRFAKEHQIGPPTARYVKARRYRRLRPRVRLAAWMLDAGRCVFPTCRRWMPLEFAHEHETIFRGRGGDPLDLENVVTTCPECHMEIHPRIGGVTRRIEGTRASGLRFYQRKNGIWEELSA